jgi:hypothetical protein
MASTFVQKPDSDRSLTKIRWRTGDYQTMLQKVPALARPPEHGPAFFKLLLRAQLALPPDRRRSEAALALDARPSRRAKLLDGFAKALEMAAAAQPEDLSAPNPTAFEAEAQTFLAEAKPAKHIYYTLEEWRALAHHPLVKRLFTGKTDPNSASVSRSCERAQHDVLPLDRHRSPKTWTTAAYKTGKNSVVTRLRDALRYPPLETSLLPPPPKEEVSQPSASAAASVPSAEIQSPEVLVNNAVRSMADGLAISIQQMMAATFTQAMTAALPAIIDACVQANQPIVRDALHGQATDITAQVRQAIFELLGGPTHPKSERPNDANLQAADVPRTYKPRVDVIGLLNGQANIVREHYGHYFSLNFIDAKHVGSRSITAPDVVMVRKFVNHDAQGLIKKSGAALHYANGGVESVLKCLTVISKVALDTPQNDPSIHA